MREKKGIVYPTSQLKSKCKCFFSVDRALVERRQYPVLFIRREIQSDFSGTRHVNALEDHNSIT